MAITAFASDGGTSSSLTPTLPFGFTASAGDLILANVGTDSGITGVSFPAPWVEVGAEVTPTNARGATAYLIATGGETSLGPTGTGSADRWEATFVRIPAGEWHGTTAPERNAAVTGNSTAPNPGSITPSWGAEANTIFVAVCFRDDSTLNTVTAYPTDYTTAQVDQNALTSSCNVASAVRIATTATEDPGAFTLSATETWGAVTWAVRPAAAGGTTFTQSLGGTLSPAGSLSRGGRKALAGSISPAGSLAKSAAKALAGAMTPAGAVAKRTARALAGSLSPGGAISSLRLFTKSFAATLSPGGSISRSSRRSLGGSLSPAGAISRRTSRALSGSVSPAGAVVKRTGRALAGGLAPAGAVVRRTGKKLAGGLAPAGSVVPNLVHAGTAYFKSFAADLSFSGSLGTAVLKALVYDVLEQFPRMVRRWPWQGRGLRPRR